MFFVAKPPKRCKSPIFCSKAIEKSDGSYRLLPLHYNISTEEEDGSSSLPSFLQQNQNKKKH
jgi:hypothetical protein